MTLPPFPYIDPASLPERKSSSTHGRWFHDREDEVAKLIADGCSAAAVASRFPGATRSGVIGLAQRRGWKFVTKPLALSKRAVKDRMVRVRKRPVAPPPPALLDDEVPNMSLRGSSNSSLVPALPRAVPVFSYASVPFMDLSIRMCRWMDGEPSPAALCCGNDTDDVWTVTPYCPHHSRKAHSRVKTPAEYREAQAARELARRAALRAKRD